MLCRGGGRPRDPLPVSGQVHVPRTSDEFAELGWACSKPRGRAVIPETTTERAPIARVWMFAILPLVLLAGLLFLLMRSALPASFQQEGVPPVERLVIERAVLGPEGIRLTVLNDGPDPSPSRR